MTRLFIAFIEYLRHKMYNNNMRNIALIGLGPHGKRIYIKYLESNNYKISLLVDLESNKKKIDRYIKTECKIIEDAYYVPDIEKDNLELSKKTAKGLLSAIKKNDVDCVIISTEPKAHFAYAKFFLKNNISILMDKPITAPVNVVTDTKSIKRISDEYYELLELYNYQKIKNEKVQFKIQCQRRFHEGYLYVRRIINECIEKYNIPITYIDIYHCDGKWMMPDEFFYLENHPYKYGYGKLFHSGYHFVDLLTWFIECNYQLKDKRYTDVSVYTEALFPKDSFYVFNNTDYGNILKTTKFHEIMSQDTAGLGEIDIHSMISFYSSGHLVTNCSLNLMQSGFSRRPWIDLPEDAYKSNGRVRHERINIQIGPLMNIQVHSYQSCESKDRKLHGGSKVGDLEHFDVYIFKNSDILGGKPFEKVQLCDLTKKKNNFIGYNEQARETCLLNFLNNIDDDADFNKHIQSILLTEQLYKSISRDGDKVQFNFRKTLGNRYGLISLIKDNKETTDTDYTKPTRARYAARGIVYDDSGRIAMVYKTKFDEYKLPGGGIEHDEEPRAAFSRECEEELGYSIGNIESLGYIIEDESSDNFMQTSFVFVAKAELKLPSNNPTKDEINDGLSIVWLNKIDALLRMQECIERDKNSFIFRRDTKILRYFLEINDEINSL